VHAAQGATADTTHTVLGENTTRSMLYVAMTRGRSARRSSRPRHHRQPRPADHRTPGRCPNTQRRTA
jgi:hypothetical protein